MPRGIYRSVYLEFWIRFSDRWQGHRTGRNKIFHIWHEVGNRIIAAAEGRGSGPLACVIGIQGVPDRRSLLMPNVDRSAQFVRGRWHHVAVLVTGNVPGTPTGVIRWWLDGRLAGEYRDLTLLRLGESPYLLQVQWSATWGGRGDTVRVEQTMALDHILFSAGR